MYSRLFGGEFVGLTVYPSDTTTHTDAVLVTITVLGHYLH